MSAPMQHGPPPVRVPGGTQVASPTPPAPILCELDEGEPKAKGLLGAPNLAVVDATVHVIGAVLILMSILTVAGMFDVHVPYGCPPDIAAMTVPLRITGLAILVGVSLGGLLLCAIYWAIRSRA